MHTSDCMDEGCTKQFSLTELNANANTQTTYSSLKPTDSPTTPDGPIVSEMSTPPDCSDCLKLSNCLTLPEYQTVPTCPAQSVSVTQTATNDYKNCTPCQSATTWTRCSTTTELTTIVIETVSTSTITLSTVSTEDNTATQSTAVLSSTITTCTKCPLNMPITSTSTIWTHIEPTIVTSIVTTASIDESSEKTISTGCSSSPLIALGALLGIFMVLLVLVTAGWVWTCWTMKKRGGMKLTSRESK